MAGRPWYDVTWCWTGTAWTEAELIGNDAHATALALRAQGIPAVAGRRSIGAPEGPPRAAAGGVQ